MQINTVQNRKILLASVTVAALFCAADASLKARYSAETVESAEAFTTAQSYKQVALARHLLERIERARELDVATDPEIKAVIKTDINAIVAAWQPKFADYSAKAATAAELHFVAECRAAFPWTAFAKSVGRSDSYQAPKPADMGSISPHTCSNLL